MKFAAKSLLSLITVAATFASAQTLPHFQHIIIVVQESRTPDNLFGAPGYPCGSEEPFETGVDIENGGYGYVPQSNNTVVYEPICNTSLPLSSWDPNLAKPQGLDPTTDTQAGGRTTTVASWTVSAMSTKTIPTYNGGTYNSGVAFEITP
jgi:hypothetical protein